MEIFRKPKDQISFEDVENFCREGIPEGIMVEYKEDFPKTPKKAKKKEDPNKKIAKVVASFANTYGGIFLIGVETDDTNRPKLPLKKINLTSGLEEKITSICFKRIEPPVIPEVVSIEDPSTPGKGIILVRVQESNTTLPHVIDGTDIYVRLNSESQPVKAEIETIRDLLLKRKNWEDKKEYLIGRARERADIIGWNNNDVIVELSSIPLYPRKCITTYSMIQHILEKLMTIDNPFYQMSLLPLKPNKNRDTANHSIIFMEKTQDKEYFEINIFGLLFHKFELHKQGGSGNSYYPLDELVESICNFLLFSTCFYKAIGYWGIIEFNLRLSNIYQKNFNIQGVDADSKMKSGLQRGKTVIDRTLHLKDTIPMHFLTKELFEETSHKLIENIVRSLNANILKEIIKSICDSFIKKHPIDTVHSVCYLEDTKE